ASYSRLEIYNTNQDCAQIVGVSYTALGSCNTLTVGAGCQFRLNQNFWTGVSRRLCNSLPFNQQNLCSNVLDDTCRKLNVQGQSLSDSMWAGLFDLELQSGSLGKKIEEKYYQDQLGD
uniref:Uncharacterized protein n=1 Tax=Romanomermis culicivorax TaxID=13658 RepID=A0A915I6G8_ROMCU